MRRSCLARAVLTNYHTLDGMDKGRSLCYSSEGGNSTSGCQHGQGLVRALFLAYMHPPMAQKGLMSFPLLERKPVLLDGDGTLRILVNLYHLLKGPISKYSHTDSIM